MSKTLDIVHFNDVYRVGEQKIAGDTFDVTQFSYMLNEVRKSWQEGSPGLTLFSGDVFSPSVESSVTRGSHLVPVMNHLAPDVSLTGNHDFDFGYPHLTKLMKDTKFPWVLSNIVDTDTGKTPAGLEPFKVLSVSGLTVGVIGLVEQEWIATVSSWPANFKYRDMAETTIELSKSLRGEEYNCDLILALTHARLPNDIKLAKAVSALSPLAQESNPIDDKHGADILLGGHDHLYYVGRGVSEWTQLSKAEQWEKYDLKQDVLGAEEDKGDVLAIKSGTDFRELSEIRLELKQTNGVRKFVISKITGKRHPTRSSLPSDEKLKECLKDQLKSVATALKKPVCKVADELDVRSDRIRLDESSSTNWFADIIRHAYDDALCMRGCGNGVDGVFVCAGTFRGDSTYGPGLVTLGNIMEILPFEDPLVVIELDGEALWDALEGGLGMWPAQEGRFPVLSGIRVEWDSSKERGSRVLSVALDLDEDEPIPRSRDTRKYRILTREYMSEGHDGYEAMKERGTYIIGDEEGQMFSTVVRQYLMGTHFVNRLSRITEHPSSEDLTQTTKAAVKREKQRKEEHHADIAQRWQSAAKKALKATKQHFQDHIKISFTEHMSGVDVYDGNTSRLGGVQSEEDGAFEIPEEDLLVVHLSVDGRLKDIARAK